MNTMESPQAYIERQKEGDPRRLRAMKAIVLACDELRGCKSTDFSVAMIASKARPHGGPSAKAVHNNTPSGVAYQRLISIYCEYHGVGGKEPGSLAAADRLLHGVRDPGQRALVRELQAEVQALRGALNAQKALQARNAHVTLLLSTEGDAHLATAVIGQQLQVRLLPSELDAFRGAKARFEKEGMKTDSRGRVIDRDGRELQPVGFVTGILKIVQSSEDLPQQEQ